jgi:hypothetical protein
MILLKYIAVNIVEALLRGFPLPCKTGLIKIGSPDRNSPVFLTCNYHLTVERVKRALKKMDCYLLVANSPVDEPVTKGLYRYSRHPMYVILPLIFIGTSIVSASWLFLLLSILLIITHFYNAIRKLLRNFANSSPVRRNRNRKEQI